MADRETVVIVDGARTPFGKFGGAFKDVEVTDLGVAAAKGALERSKVEPEWIDHVIFGNVIHTSKNASYLSRHIALKAGIPQDAPALTLNRLCGSGLEAIITGARMILLGEAEFVLAGGAENMSRAPHVTWGLRWGIRMGAEQMEDMLWATLTDAYEDLPMAITSENLSERYNISREEQDRFAYQSQMRTKTAINTGHLTEEIVSVEVPNGRDDSTLVQQDEHPRPETTLEGLARLKPHFKEDGGVTAGNASGIVDGAAAVVVTTLGAAEERGLEPIGRLVSWGTAGVDPAYMGIGPAPATRQALKRAGMSLGDLDLIEVNEAFAGQCLAVCKELEIDQERLNVNGGAIAIGHPVGATGTRLTLTALYELRRRGQQYGLSTMCIGGGQGVAAILEAL